VREREERKERRNRARTDERVKEFLHIGRNQRVDIVGDDDELVLEVRDKRVPTGQRVIFQVDGVTRSRGSSSSKGW
jgi:hypothetical protein